MMFRLPKMPVIHRGDPAWMQGLKRNFQEVVRALRVINRLTGDGENIVIDGEIIRFVGTLSTVGSFSQTQGGTNGETIVIGDGYVNLHEIGNYYFEEQTITLTGGPFAFIYVWLDVNNWSSNGISVASGAAASDAPVSGSTRIQITLWQYEFSASGSYTGAKARAGGNDIQFMTPQRQ